eukprot:SAG31_NODE_13869_length_841_cov_1.114555_2_plen_107_part_00
MLYSSILRQVAQPAYFTQYYVRWLDFANAVDMANTIKGLENIPLGETTYRAPVHADGRGAGMSAPPVLETLKEEIRVRGVLVKHFFQVRRGAQLVSVKPCGNAPLF